MTDQRDETTGPPRHGGERAKPPTIIDVARRAGVSKSAVSRALLGQGEVSEAVRTRVMRAADDLGYVANAIAQGLVRSRTRTLGVVLRDVTNTYYGQLFAATQERAEALGYRVVTATSAGEMNLPDAVRALRAMVSLRVDGLIMASAQLASEELLPFTDRVPIVTAGRMDIDPAITSVYCDDEDGGRVMALRVVEAGHRSVAVVVVSREYSLSQCLRGLGMLDELGRHGVDIVRCPVDRDDDVVAIADRLAADESITAIMCPTDIAMVSVLDALRRAGRRVPEDISVTGYDGIGILTTPLLGLTTFRQPVVEIGHTAIDLLVEFIEDAGARTGRHVAIRGEFVPGRTLATPPAR